MDPATEAAAKAAIEDLSRHGSPVARPESTDTLLSLGWRRWRSFERRHKKGPDDLDARVEDLAKGLRAAIEPDEKLVGPLMEDYRHLARVLGHVFTAHADEPNEG